MTTEVDLLEAAAATLVFTVESSLSMVEMIAQASYDITVLKLRRKWSFTPVTSAPELTEVNPHFTFIQKNLYKVSCALVGVEFQACDF